LIHGSTEYYCIEYYLKRFREDRLFNLSIGLEVEPQTRLYFLVGKAVLGGVKH
jgi:hypothetical protein